MLVVFEIIHSCLLLTLLPILIFSLSKCVKTLSGKYNFTYNNTPHKIAYIVAYILYTHIYRLYIYIYTYIYCVYINISWTVVVLPKRSLNINASRKTGNKIQHLIRKKKYKYMTKI